tara:strand:+ start:3558 stop:4559 length:1002 start_codon:yes stop_codon:yes gene_type:complete
MDSFLRRTSLIVGLLLAPAMAKAEWFQFSGTAMTTPIQMEFWGDSETEAKRISQRVFDEFDRIDAQMSRYRERSELSAVNREAAEHPVVVSSGLFRVFEKAQEVSELSDGAFDISFGSVGYLYDFREKKQPTAEEVQQHLPEINYRDIELNKAERSVSFRKAGLLTDMGGIAKGYSVDRGIAILKSEGIRHARLSAGGDMYLLGDKRGRPWVVGVRDPRQAAKNAVVLPVSNVAISTSGDYERFFIDEEGNRVHHILSPKSGRPVEGIQSVTIIGNDTLTTDGLSTAVFVLGVEKGLAMINKLDGIDAIIIDSDRKLHYSRGLLDPQDASAPE